ncbi:MAG TPA: hypothetical protein VM639_16745 [Dongiaceae bacterium]|nr:hypothetical protein [Dongiaceae bacterium]
MACTLPFNKLTKNNITLKLQSFVRSCDFRHISTRLAALLFLLAAGEMSFPANALARENVDTVPSAQLVSDFFAHILEVVFHHQTSDDPAYRHGALKTVLARSIDAETISRFILGRYAASPVPLPANGTDPQDSFLDFATTEILRMTPAKDAKPDQSPIPSLAISHMTMRRDQTRIVASELVWPDGRRLALAWEVADRPGIGLRIEDVNCLGISLRLMLRSAVAEAAAEHPENSANLAHLLNSGRHLGPLHPSEKPTQ